MALPGNRGGARTALVLVIIISFLCWAEGRVYSAETNLPVPNTEEKPADPSKPVATVNGVTIPYKNLNRAVLDRIPQTGHGAISEKRLAEIGGELLDGLIVQEILLQEAKRLQIKAPPKLIEEEVQKIRSRFPSDETYREALKGQGLTPDDIKNGVIRYLMIKQLSEQEVRSKIKIGNEQMRSYYSEHPEKFKMPEQVRLRVLLVGVEPSSPSTDWEKAREKAEGFANQAKKGEDFSALARQFSDDEDTKGKGGDTGLLHQGRLPFAELESVAYSQEVGSVSDPVRTLYGYVIFKVEEKRPAEQLPYDRLNKDLLRKEMEASATDAKLKEWIDGLRAKADVKIY